MTGRTHHPVGMAGITEVATGFPGYNGMNGIDAGEATGTGCNDSSRVIGCARCIALDGYGGGNGGFAVGCTGFGN